MAKTKQCSFCGKEIENKLFSTDVKVLDAGIFINCCDECYAKYEKFAENEKERFSVKMDNYRTGNKIGIFKSLGNKEADLFIKYYEEGQEYLAKSNGLQPVVPLGFYHVDEAGHFWANEASLTGATSFSVTDDQYNTFSSNSDVEGTAAFSKDDISRLDFYIDKLVNQIDMFHSLFDVYIRINDEKEITYKPCILKTVVSGGFLIGNRKRAKKELIERLENMKEILGLNVEIVEYKKKFK